MCARLLLTLTSIALVFCASRNARASDCPEKTEAAELRLEADRTSDEVKAELARALADALETLCDVADQRDDALGQVDDIQTDRDRQAMRGDMLEERVAKLELRLETPAPESWRAPLALHVATRTLELAGAAAVGWCVGAGCPAEVTVGVAVATVAAIVGDVVLGWLERRDAGARAESRRGDRRARGIVGQLFLLRES